jgi:hypothetical protein
VEEAAEEGAAVEIEVEGGTVEAKVEEECSVRTLSCSLTDSASSGSTARLEAAWVVTEVVEEGEEGTEEGAAVEMEGEGRTVEAEAEVVTVVVEEEEAEEGAAVEMVEGGTVEAEVGAAETACETLMAVLRGSTA